MNFKRGTCEYVDSPYATTLYSSSSGSPKVLFPYEKGTSIKRTPLARGCGHLKKGASIQVKIQFKTDTFSEIIKKNTTKFKFILVNPTPLI